MFDSGPLGKFCGTPGLAEPEGDCDAGFFCLRGSSVPNPIGKTFFLLFLFESSLTCLACLTFEEFFCNVYSLFCSFFTENRRRPQYWWTLYSESLLPRGNLHPLGVSGGNIQQHHWPSELHCVQGGLLLQ